MEIPIYYDPMIAKLITYGDTREAAIQKMLEAISNYKIEGIQTTLSFGKYVCEHENFVSGDFDTHFVKNFYSVDKLKSQFETEAELAGQVALKLYLESKKELVGGNLATSSWKSNRL